MAEETPERMIERMAKAMHDADWRQQIGLTPDGAPRSWETNPEQEWWRTMAQAALTAMIEPTIEIDAATRAELTWMKDQRQIEAWVAERRLQWQLTIRALL